VRLFAVCALTSSCVFGQAILSARAGLISYLEGAVYSDAQQAGGGAQLREGQRLRTEMGRAEVLLGIGAVLRLGEGGMLRMENTQLTDTKVVLEQGSALVEVTELIKGTRIRIYFRDTAAEFARPGWYRLDTSPAQMRVYGGEAVVSDAQRKTRAKRGQAVALAGSLAVSKFDRKQQDALHRWAAQRSFDLAADQRRRAVEEIDQRNRQTPLGRNTPYDNGHLGITNPSGVKPSPGDLQHQGPGRPQEQN
jgi:hypothetical protein